MTKNAEQAAREWADRNLGSFKPLFRAEIAAAASESLPKVVRDAFLAGCEHEAKRWQSVMISSENGYPDDESGDYRAGYDACWLTIQRLIGNVKD